MKLALLMGNRFNPWHLLGLARMQDRVAVTAFRADSQIQSHFAERDDGSATFQTERIYFDTQAGPALARMRHVFEERYRNREPRILPFADRLAGFDLIHTWELFTDWSTQAVEAKRLSGTPVVTTVWDLLPFNMETKPHHRENKKRVANATDRFIVYTERSRRTLHLEGINDKRIAYVPPGVDTSLFSPSAGDRHAAGLPEDAFVILFVGWFLPRKGIDFLLTAVRDCLDRGCTKPIHLVLVGAGAGRDRVEAIVRRLRLEGNVTFTGAQPYDAMPNWFRCCDTFVLPSVATDSWQEQFGMSLIEAMACGKPAIASLSGAIEEVAGDAALLVQPNDFTAISDAIQRLMGSADLRNEIGARARQRACNSFSLERHQQHLWQTYQDALAR